MDKDGLYDELCHDMQGSYLETVVGNKIFYCRGNACRGLGLLDLVRIDTVSAY